MKKLDAPLLNDLMSNTSLEQVSLSLNKLAKHSIAIAPWPEFAYVPKVEFSIAHSGDCIFIKYYVQESVIKATYYKPNDPVYKDSCVEFFISFDDEDEYYNLEFNAIGTCKLNFGINRNQRQIIPDDLVQKIKYYTTIKNQAISETNTEIHWELTLMIPLEVFSKHKIKSLTGRHCAANFYKCGDELPVPHYLCWNNIESVVPDFHLRQFFGKILFL